MHVLEQGDALKIQIPYSSFGVIFPIFKGDNSHHYWTGTMKFSRMVGMSTDIHP